MPAPKGNEYAKGNGGGRPRKYEIADLPKLADDMRAWFLLHLEELDEKRDLPFLEQYARTIGISHDTLSSYCGDSEEFSVAYKECKELQRQILIKGGLKGIFNPSAFIFTAKNIAGMRDKTEVENSGQITVNITRYEADNPAA